MWPMAAGSERRKHIDALWFSCFWSLAREFSSPASAGRSCFFTLDTGPCSWVEKWAEVGGGCPVLCRVTLFGPALLAWVCPLPGSPSHSVLYLQYLAQRLPHRGAGYVPVCVYVCMYVYMYIYVYACVSV